jgi:hypothetical protein
LGLTGAIPELGPPPAVGQILPGALIADLWLVAAMALDWRTRGRVHPVYRVGGAALLLLQDTRAWVSETTAWHAVAAWIVVIAG